jgi:membrane protease YdiL (CAAX protease family)
MAHPGFCFAGGLAARGFYRGSNGPTMEVDTRGAEGNQLALLFWVGSVVILAILRALLTGLPNGLGVKFILPMGRHEMLGWIALSVSAGICEEAIFRGYLQRQFMAATQNVDVALVLTSIFFGLMHLYQGVKGAILIGTLGLLLGLLARWRGTVRTGMIAHAWQDSVAGIVRRSLRH